ncbi:hypothetical protein [Ramlibacter sp.]|uniref:hypothetical protein n=1 Tax=Ramlibacter sp. TaxID=1917967 RepID=UPI002C9ADCC8|nr:hypothetical protein [Ramlibacter sp.]HWI83652.1 hypothetical protein [Ramlibacter sp.]
MKARLFLVAYVGVWVVIAAAAIYFAVSHGFSWWHAAVPSYLLFLFLNGSLAYVFTKRRLESEGRQAPPYLSYLFLPKGKPQRISVPRPIRALFGIVIFLGGLLFVAFGALLVSGPNLSSAPHPIEAAALLLLLVAMGVLFMYVGGRLVVMRADEALFQNPWHGRPK